MGVRGNEDIFPNAVVYKGVSDTPQSYRGETGAQDSIIPSVDISLGLEYPRNQLTEYLFEMRDYRPAYHSGYHNLVEQQQTGTGLKKWAMEDNFMTF